MNQLDFTVEICKIIILIKCNLIGNMLSGRLVTFIKVSSAEKRNNCTGPKTEQYHVGNPFNFVCDLFLLVCDPLVTKATHTILSLIYCLD